MILSRAEAEHVTLRQHAGRDTRAVAVAVAVGGQGVWVWVGVTLQSADQTQQLHN